MYLTSKKNYSLVFLEGIVVALSLVILSVLIKHVYKTDSTLEIVALSGFLLHLIFEYTSLNEMYSVNYCKLL